jgi:signal transduction histidine kinase
MKGAVEGTLQSFREGNLDRALHVPAEILGEIKDQLQDRARSAGVNIKVGVGSGLPPISVDRTLLVTALVGIAENAVDAIFDGGTLWLEAEALPERELVRFRISDNGSGIAEGIREKIFDPFFTTKRGGTGLGLAIAHGVIQGHGGRILVEQRPGGGTVVTAELHNG